jgi:hypothetical protein
MMTNPTEADLNPSGTGLGSGAHHTGGTGVGTSTGTGMRPDNGYAGSNVGTGSTNAGPHNSNLANKVDPRVDSDMDGRNGFDTTSGAATGGMTRPSETRQQFGEAGNQTRGNGLNTKTSTETKPSMMEKIKRAL